MELYSEEEWGRLANLLFKLSLEDLMMLNDKYGVFILPNKPELEYTDYKEMLAGIPKQELLNYVEKLATKRRFA